MNRWLLLTHRYLGIAVGVLMVMWCVSGVVMMYVSYPALDEGRRIGHLAPIVWNDCCKISDQQLADADPVTEFRVEMLAGRPILYLRDTYQPAVAVDLTSGLPISRVSTDQADTVALAYAKTVPSVPRLLGLIDTDQWTVDGSFNRDRPLYHFRLDDGHGTELYISSTTGRVVQITTARERFWNWLGAVPHWLYFVELRHQVALWSQVVIATSLVGCFLTVLGLYIGVQQMLRRPAGRWSPYRGFSLWHHIAGLFFGVLTLTWVLSGLLSMNPWGWLEGEGAQAEREQLRGAPLSGAQVRSSLEALARKNLTGIVFIQSAPLDGHPYFLAGEHGGARWRIDATAMPAPLNDADMTYIATVLGDTHSAHMPALMTREDSYYFSHHRDVVQLPVYRLISQDGSATRYYIDPVSGSLLEKFDRSSQGYRWWHEGLHRMDFTALLRSRPQWDVLMLLLMSGVTTVCVTGAYLGYRRLMGR